MIKINVISYNTVLPPAAIQLTQEEMHGMPTLTMSNPTSTGGTILQYASQDGNFFVPGNIHSSNLI